MKKDYQKPKMVATEMEPSGILCVSLAIDPIPGGGFGGG